jgi:hypothetical protein
MRPDIDIEPVAKQFWRSDQQLLLILDYISDEIWQPAIGERYERTAIEDGDFGGFIQPPHPGRARRAARNTADNYYTLSRFH